MTDEFESNDVSLPSLRILRAEDLGDVEVRPLFSPGVRIVRRRVVEDLSTLSDRVELAHRRAEEIVRTAEAEAAAIRDAAKEEGQAEGQQQWADALVELERERGRIVSEAESDLVRLATQLAGRIVGRAVELEPSVAAEIVAESLQHVRGDQRITIELAPDDVAAVTELRRELSAVVGGEPIHFRENPEIARGGCVIVTQSQRVDARLSTQVEAMRRALLEGS